MSDHTTIFRPTKEALRQVVVISGAEGSGKTDWALKNSPGPHYLIDTEGGHNLHTAVRADPEVLSITLREPEDVNRSKTWFSGQGELWSQLKEAIHSLKTAPRGTVIIDSASDLVGMVVAQLSIDWSRGDSAFPPMLYGQVYGEINAQINFLRQFHHIILTARVKEKWSGEGNDSKRTGKFEVSLWKEGFYLCEHIIRVENTGDGRRYRTRVLKQAEVLLDMPPKWEWLSDGIPEEMLTASLRTELEASIDKAEELLGKKQVAFPPRPTSGSIQDLENHVASLRKLYRDNS